MRKYRGLKRYYRNLNLQNELDKIFWLNLEDTQLWPKYWHLHTDERGYGDNNFKRRKPHLDKLFRHFNLLVEKTKSLNNNFQLYAVILDYHSSSDALFLHKPDIDNNQFPIKVENLAKSTTLKNKELNAYLEHLDGYEKLYGEGNEAFCLLYIKNVGQSF